MAEDGKTGGSRCRFHRSMHTTNPIAMQLRNQERRCPDCTKRRSYSDLGYVGLVAGRRRPAPIARRSIHSPFRPLKLPIKLPKAAAPHPRATAVQHSPQETPQQSPPQPSIRRPANSRRRSKPWTPYRSTLQTEAAQQFRPPRSRTHKTARSQLPELPMGNLPPPSDRPNWQRPRQRRRSPSRPKSTGWRPAIPWRTSSRSPPSALRTPRMSR